MGTSPFHGIFSNFGQDMPRGTSAPVIADDDLDDPLPVQSTPDTGKQTGQIAVDIYEHESYYIIRAPIAGVKLTDLDIEVDDKVLTIRGVRRLTDEIPSDQYYLQECFWGEFSRSVTLPCSIDPKKVKATFSRDCILKILIPKEDRIKIIRVSEG